MTKKEKAHAVFADALLKIWDLEELTPEEASAVLNKTGYSPEQISRGMKVVAEKALKDAKEAGVQMGMSRYSDA